MSKRKKPNFHIHASRAVKEHFLDIDLQSVAMRLYRVAPKNDPRWSVGDIGHVESRITGPDTAKAFSAGCVMKGNECHVFIADTVSVKMLSEMMWDTLKL
jgi:hypothetical protein